MFKITALALAALSIYPESQFDGKNSAEQKNSELNISTSECSRKSEGNFCIEGAISSKTLDEMKKIKKISRLIINSEGGDADSAMIIGKRIFDDRAIVEVKSKCISACANYIIPAARYLEINENSFVIIHGAISRGVAEYNSLVQKKSKEKLSISSTSKNFLKVRNGILKRENEYFDYILKDDAFVTRYREQVRNLLISKKIKCEYYNDFFLILDQQYFSEFGIEVKRWPDQSDRQIFDSARYSFPKVNIIYGIDSEFVRLLNPIGRNCISLVKPQSEEVNRSATYNEKEIF